VKKVQAGDRVTITSRGLPCARLVPLEKSKKVWRVEKPDDPKLFGDLQSPVMEHWK
jgi:antitoxin (DNA-binding transcriptional repressor) of toxin-antitoxin stability system